MAAVLVLAPVVVVVVVQQALVAALTVFSLAETALQFHLSVSVADQTRINSR